MKNLPISHLISGLGIVFGGFALLYIAFTPDDLIVLLNGLFVGSLAAIGVCYRKLLLNAFIGDGHYDRYRQMTLSIFLQWVIIAIGAATSIYINTADLPTTAFIAVSFSRYLATVTAFLQITSPDLGSGIFLGRDRNVLLLSLGIGVATAVAVILMQGV